MDKSMQGRGGSVTWMEFLLPEAAPRWFLALGYTSLVLVVTSLLAIILPESAIGKSKALSGIRHWVIRTVQRFAYLTAKGPVFQLFFWCGRRCSAGRLASRCQTPTNLRIRANTCCEAAISWVAQPPSSNPFHEEHFVCAWQQVEESKEATRWNELEIWQGSEEVSVDAGNRWKTFLANLPASARLKVRVCATNRYGPSEWTPVVDVATPARPDPQTGGLTGPAGSALKGHKDCMYRWGQDKLEVTVVIPVPDDWRAKDLRVKVTPARLEILHLSSAHDFGEDVLKGSFTKKVRADEIMWEIESNEQDGRHIHLQLQKAVELEKWPALLDGADHPHIDVHLVRFYSKEALGLSKLDIWE